MKFAKIRVDTASKSTQYSIDVPFMLPESSAVRIPMNFHRIDCGCAKSVTHKFETLVILCATKGKMLTVDVQHAGVVIRVNLNGDLVVRVTTRTINDVRVPRCGQ